MTGIIEALDEITADWLTENYPALVASPVTNKLFGFCELTNRTVDNKTQPIPATINGTSDRQKVSLDDRFKFMTWIRLEDITRSSNVINGDDWAFGFDEGKVKSTNFRFILAHTVDLGEDLVYNFVDDLPNVINVDGYKLVFIDKNQITVDTDHEAIYRTELGDTVYEKHRFKWNIYAISLLCEYILGRDCVYANRPLR